MRSGTYHRGPIVTQYGPPRQFSPAMLRFIWKERFDDRTFWACVLSLVSKGHATLHEENGETVVAPADTSDRPQELSPEEALLVQSLFHDRGRKPVSLNLADEETTLAVYQISQYLHQAAVGRWFRPNFQTILMGGALSLLSVVRTASPKS